MKLSLCTLFFICLLINNVQNHSKKILCYFSSWAIYRPGNGQFLPTDIDPFLCTHYIYAFIGLNKANDGTVEILDPNADSSPPPSWYHSGFEKFINLKNRNPNGKFLIAMGGWNDQKRANYSQVMNNPVLRKNFVKNVVKFVLQYDFDGFDFDWEYPNQRGGVPEDIDSFIDTLKQLRETFTPLDLLLTAAVAGTEKSASKSYRISEMTKYLDLISIMAYDMHGPWDNEPTGLNAPLFARTNDPTPDYNVAACIKYWLENGADASKLLLGVPLYGRTFKLADSNRNQLDAPTLGAGQPGPYTREAGSIGYNEILEIIDGYEQYWNNESLVPYMVKGDNWIAFDNERSIEYKTRYAIEQGLGGVMAWSVETDDFRPLHGGQKNPLLTTIYRVLNEAK